MIKNTITYVKYKGEVNSWEDFFNYYSFMKRPSDIGIDIKIMLFRKNCQPLWEVISFLIYLSYIKIKNIHSIIFKILDNKVTSKHSIIFLKINRMYKSILILNMLNTYIK